MNACYSSPFFREIGWFALAALYIFLLLLFTHADLIIDFINSSDSDIWNMLMVKHANFVSLATNIGLLIFIMIDLMIAYGNRLPLGVATLINLIGIFSCVMVTMCAMGCVNAELKRYGALVWKEGVGICLLIFVACLVVLKMKSLNYNQSE